MAQLQPRLYGALHREVSRSMDTRQTHWPALRGAAIGPTLLAWGLQHTSGTGASLLLARLLYGEAMDRRVRTAMVQRAFGAARTGSVFAFAPFIGAVLMLAGVVLHLANSHEHEHVHEALEHEHAHTHDDGHRGHVHDPIPVGPHSQPHRHEPGRHSLPHVPDAHHAHRH
jgi:hypothetical protein